MQKRRRDHDPRSGPLTRQEERVVDLLLEGLSNLNIATRLGVQEMCIKRHLYNAFGKKGVNSRLDLALTILRERQADNDKEAIEAVKRAYEARLAALRGQYALELAAIRREYKFLFSERNSHVA